MKLPGRPLVLSVAVFGLVAAAGVALVTLAARLEREGRRRSAAEAANGAAWSIEQQLAGSLAAAHALAAVVRETRDDSSFDAVARDLYELYPGMDSLQLAPGGVLTRIYPLPGNEAAIGLDLATSPLHRGDIEKAKATRQLVLAGPFPLRQGGIGLAGRVAVFVREGDRERFWGIATSLVRLPRLLEASRLDRLGDAGYSYQLSRRGGAGLEETFASSGSARLADPVEVAVRVPNGDWTLRVAPRAGWVRRWAWAGHAVSLAAAVAFALLVQRVLRQPEELRRLVAERTEELERAHRSRQSAEEALRQAQRLEAVGRLAGGVAHDFNNLLQAVIGYVDLVIRKGDLRPALKDDLQQARKAAERAANLTRQMLAFGRRQVLERTALDLNAVVSDLMKMLARLIGEQIELQLALGESLGTVWADRGQLEQVIVNLCVNARDAMPEAGRLVIETRNAVIDDATRPLHPEARRGRFVRLAVTDTGVGIAPDLVEHVFEPFFTTKQPGLGTGLGLATVHGIVHQHGGWVEVESEPGSGTTFRVYLPLAERAADAPAARAEAPACGGQGTILLAEDDEAVRTLTERVLREAGYDVLTARDGEEALRAAAAHGAGIDLALLDVVMPRCSGRQVRDRLRETHPRTVVLFASGYSDDALQTDFLRQERVRLLQKPYAHGALLQAVREALGSRVPADGHRPTPTGRA